MKNAHKGLVRALIGMSLLSGFAGLGCASDAMVASSSEGATVETAGNGMAVGLVSEAQLDAHLEANREAAPELEPLESHMTPADGDATDGIEKARCWVTLLYCDDPRFGVPSCSYTSGCTITRAADACAGLIGSTC